MNESELQRNFDYQAGRVKDKAADLVNVKADLSAIVGQLVDADQKARPGLIARRAELVNLAGLLVDELKELTSRRDSGELAIYDFAEAREKTELERLASIATDARQAMNAAMDAHRRGLGGGRSQTEEDIRKMLELELTVSRARAASEIANRDAARQKIMHDNARAAATEARERLGVKA